MEGLRALTCRRCPIELYADLGAFADTGELRCGRAVRHDLQISHASQDSKNLSRSTFRVRVADFRNLFAADRDLERRFAGKKRRYILRSDVGDEISEAIHFQ